MFSGCSESRYNQTERRVHIRKQNGKYVLYKNNKPFFIKGAGGSANLNLLKQLGGNAIRIWDTTNLGVVLDSAHANNISVIVGLPVQNSNVADMYQDPDRIAAQHRAFKKIVNRFRKHPAVLMWCVGNELDFPYGLSYNRFYRAYNDLTDMIHQDDPHHPVTTTVLNFNPKYIATLQIRCDIDLISFNIFSLLDTFRENLKHHLWLWNGPYMVLEWGIDGPWQGTMQTAWGAYIEKTSTEKAAIYGERYLRYMPLESQRFLGGFVFFWGNKQETTHTWFSIFDAEGRKTAAVKTMKYLWTGKTLNETFPEIKHMRVENRDAYQNIILVPNRKSQAEVTLLSSADSIKTIKWQIFKEDWFKKNNENSTRLLKPLSQLMKADQGLKAVFTTPAQEGPYRIFATVYDHKGNLATCNTPFYVLSTR
ncbi:hypothetical protein FEM33_20050 [Dyadobacter flavalbus]|uniref:Glycoside hydrolase family 2 catalytic domain-containing protein n=1 Tax=Dyadobacter flavalbus TaxID=2579942 RepID=A0A5M8QQ19_9BACT|nr:glycoside hydrolase family 2 TIM barrel-domain containing protein [Dyadobacter flavalbus]KAA6437094.1 hypothetical protein FEM33_20050 [Dyadobacter flavalbus]